MPSCYHAQVSGLGSLPYYIEVKTTTIATKSFVEMSPNEVAMANEHRSQFVLLRLWGHLQLGDASAEASPRHVYLVHKHIALPDPLFCGYTELQLHGMLHAEQEVGSSAWTQADLLSA